MFGIQVFLFCVVVVLLQAFTLYKLHSYRMLVEEKNLKLIQFYLDMKFIWQCISHALSSSNNIDACNRLVDSIKDYYSFEDLLVVGSSTFTCSGKDTKLKRDVAVYIAQNNLRIKEFLNNHDFFIESFAHQDINYNLYINSTSNSKNSKEDGLIVSVDRNPYILSQNEMICFESCINLLKLNISAL